MSEVTRILCALEQGDPHAASRLLPLVYDELRKLAAQRMAQEQPGQTLDATALVHEAYLRLVGNNPGQPWNSRGHFFAAAAQAMRRILVENARRKRRHKHGGSRSRVPLEGIELAAPTRGEELLALDEALTQLAAADTQAAELVQLRYFAGLTIRQAAEILFLIVALVVAFGFEFINGFHDTANAVTTVIYTRTMKPTPAVVYSGLMTFLGVLLGGTAVAFSIVNLLPVELLVEANSVAPLVMVLSLLLAGVIWKLGTWYLGIPVSSSHALLGSILGVGLANSLSSGRGLAGVNWAKAGEVGLALLISPLIGFGLAGLLLLAIKRTLPEPQLYVPPQGDDRPPGCVRWVLVGTCGGVSLAHGSNDGQKGMGLILLVLIGFLPTQYALDLHHPEKVRAVHAALAQLRQAGQAPADDLLYLEQRLARVESFTDLPAAERWEVHQALFRLTRAAQADPVLRDRESDRKVLSAAIEFVPLWVVVGVALALGVGTLIGYKRIVITVAEKIGKTHLTYAQGAAAEVVAAATILAADVAHAPVSTTQVLSSGVAGTMAANGSGVQGSTCRKILLAWGFTLPGTILLAGALFTAGRWLAG